MDHRAAYDTCCRSRVRQFPAIQLQDSLLTDLEWSSGQTLDSLRALRNFRNLKVSPKDPPAALSSPVSSAPGDGSGVTLPATDFSLALAFSLNICRSCSSECVFGLSPECSTSLAVSRHKASTSAATMSSLRLCCTRSIWPVSMRNFSIIARMFR